MAEAAEYVRPPTLRQKALAAAIVSGNVKTVTEAAELVGLNRSHASRSLHQNATVISEIDRLRTRQRDKARGLDAIIERTVGKPELVDELDPRDKLQLGLAAMKLRADLGVEPERGNGLAFVEWKKRRLRRSSSMLIRMHASGIGPLGWRAPQHVVLSPAVTELSTEK